MDDGSRFRHTSVGFVAAAVLSAIAPVVGYFVAVQLAVRYEAGKTDADSLADIEYGRTGARYGAVLGSGIGLMIWSFSGGSHALQRCCDI